MADDRLPEQVDDRVPEEREDGNAQLIALLRRELRGPLVIPATEEAHIVARVRDRLRGVDEVSHGPAGAPTARPVEPEPAPVAWVSTAGRRLPRWVRDCVAVLLVGTLVGASLLLFRSSLLQPATSVPTASTGPTAQVQVDGLRASIHLVTPGPYFLSELLSADLSLTNLSGKPFTLDGTSKPDSACFTSALSAQVIGGSSPSYTVPALDIGCLDFLPLTTMAPGQALTIRQYLPVTMSGMVTVAMGGMLGTRQMTPLNGHWPTLSIRADSRVPPDRTLMLHDQGSEVLIQAPPEARDGLLYRQSISCSGYVGGSPADWSPLTTTLLSHPACPTTPARWKYLRGRRRLRDRGG